jgi:glycosyltransferase involved in cell wall biosynthesis
VTKSVSERTDLVVAIDGLSLSDGSRLRGIGTYVRHLVEDLPSTGAVRPKVVAPALQSSALDRMLPHRYRHRRAARRHDRWLAGAVSASGADVLHSPAQSPPDRSAVPWVQTLHDLTPFVIDHPLLAADRRHWIEVGPRLHRAAEVICVSQSSADQAIRFLGLPSERLHVIPHGVDPSFNPAGPIHHADAPYLLWLSAWGPHKGLSDALIVVAQLAAAGLPHKLLVAGPQDDWMHRQIQREVAAAERPDLVSVVGFVEDLPAVYRGAAALVVTSRAEGFCLPALEAMACGTPVVAYDNTALPELIGDAGVLVPDGDVGRFTDLIAGLLRDPEAAADLRTAGVAQAAGYTWRRCAQRHLEVYRRAADTGPAGRVGSPSTAST